MKTILKNPILYNFFNKILNAPTTEIAEIAYNEAMNTAIFPNIITG